MPNFELKIKSFKKIKETTHTQKYEKMHWHWLWKGFHICAPIRDSCDSYKIGFFEKDISSLLTWRFCDGNKANESAAELVSGRSIASGLAHVEFLK